jgi:hypothetical protein
MEEKILLEELLQSLEKELQKAGLTKGSIAQYRCQGIYPYREYYHKAEMKFYDSKFNEQIISEVESKYMQGLITPKRMWATRKVATLLNGFNETGEIILKRITRSCILFQAVLYPFRDCCGLSMPCSLNKRQSSGK